MALKAHFSSLALQKTWLFVCFWQGKVSDQMPSCRLDGMVERWDMMTSHSALSLEGGTSPHSTHTGAGEWKVTLQGNLQLTQHGSFPEASTEIRSASNTAVEFPHPLADPESSCCHQRGQWGEKARMFCPCAERENTGSLPWAGWIQERVHRVWSRVILVFASAGVLESRTEGRRAFSRINRRGKELAKGMGKLLAGGA